jgi:hypothetical protein
VSAWLGERDSLCLLAHLLAAAEQLVEIASRALIVTSAVIFAM